MARIAFGDIKVDFWSKATPYTVIAGGDKTLILELKPALVQAFEKSIDQTEKFTATMKALEETLVRIKWTNTR